MLLYSCFRCLWAFIQFYIIFGTNLLTVGQPILLFFAYFSVSKKRNIKGSPNGMKPSGELFLERKQSRRLGVDIREASRWPRGREVRLPPWACPHPCGLLVAPLTNFFRLYMSICPKTFGEQNRSGVPPPQASVATKNQSGPCSGTLPEGGIPHRWPSSSSRRSP